ncbi:hypothetical protein Vretimale_1393, partial [Volvox reticuliferus]
MDADDGGAGSGGRCTTGSGPSSASPFIPVPGVSAGATAASGSGGNRPDAGGGNAATAAATAGGGADHSIGASAGSGLAVIEVVTEEVYEYQVREPWGTWQGASADEDMALVSCTGGAATGSAGAGGTITGGGGGVGGSSSSTWRGREEVELPRGGGWLWAGDWVVDMRGGQQHGGSSAAAAAAAAAGPPVDAEGWEYRSTAGPGGQRTWTAVPDATCTSRRRRWVRQRRRRLPAPASVPPIGGAAAGGGSLGRMPSARGTGTPTAAAAAGAIGAAAIGSGASGQGPDGGALGPGAAGTSTADGIAGGASTGAIIRGGGGGLGTAGNGACGSAAAAAAAAPNAGQGLALVAVLLCTTLRGARLQESKLCVLRLLMASADECDDYVRLQWVVPYLLTALHDTSAAVRCLSVRGIARTLTRVQALPPSDIKYFQDYVLPSMSLTPNDFEESVRVEYGMALAHLAAAAHRHLLRLQSDNNAAAAAAAAAVAAATGLTPGPAPPPIRYDAEVAAVRSQIERGVVELVTGLRSSVDVKRALLSHVYLLAEAFGRRGVTELLLPLLITCLNAPEGRLRAAFFRAVGSLGPQDLGGEALDAFLLPCMEQALTDPEPRVVCDAVRCLVAVTPQLRKRSLLAAAGKVVPLLRHNNPAVRGAAVALVAAAASHLPKADVYAQLAVLVAPHLRRMPPLLNDAQLLADCLVTRDRTRAGGGGGGGDGELDGESQQQHQHLGMLRGKDSGSRAYGGRRSYNSMSSECSRDTYYDSSRSLATQAELLSAATDKLSVPLRTAGSAGAGVGAAVAATASGSGSTAQATAVTTSAAAAASAASAVGAPAPLRVAAEVAGGGGGGGDSSEGSFHGCPLLEGLSGPEDAADLFLRPAAPLYT